jgi:hypothetical protein
VARKFNIGRQNEQLMNDELHRLFMSLKYLNYERYKYIEEPFQEKQTEIPDHALRIQSKDGIDFIEAHYPKLDSGNWKPLFEGYYHPANTRKPGSTTYVVPYQLCIDPETGAIQFWDPGNLCWTLARAGEYVGELNTFNGLNYQCIRNLKEVNKVYPVPYVKFGKLFNGTEMIPYSDFENVNDCAVAGLPPSSDYTWIHINSSKLTNIERRLIQVDRAAGSKGRGFIGVPSTHTEFYGFNPDVKLGDFLRKDLDYYDVPNGIQLKAPSMYKYVYAITYSFDNYPSKEGELLKGSKVIGSQNEVYIGEAVENVTLFLDGLSLEETDEENRALYTYDRSEGTVIFSNDEDAEVLNNMQMATLMFPKKTSEFSASTNSPSNSVAIFQNSIKLNIGNNIEGYKTPMVFVSGLGLQETNIFDDIEIQNNLVTIKNFVMAKNEIYKIFIADVGDSYVCKGVLNGSYIENDKIDGTKEYIVFVNGILLTPTNGDLTISQGKIRIADAENSRFDELHYVVFEIDDSDYNKIGLIFDETITSYSLRIDDYGENSSYNDCNTAIAYVKTNDDQGILLDQNAVLKPIHALEGYYKAGQIIKTEDYFGNENYYIYDFTEDEPEPLDKNSINEIKELYGYYATKGSIHLIDKNQSLRGSTIVYYAYNYANTIDEVAIKGRKMDLRIPANVGDTTYEGAAKRTEVWQANCNSLATYINGVETRNYEKDIVDGVTQEFVVTYKGMPMNFNKNYYKLSDNEMTLVLDALYMSYKTKSDAEILGLDIKAEQITLLNGNKYKLKDIFFTNGLLLDAFHLAKYINEDMTRESITYIVEKIEGDEFIAVEKDYIDLETNNPTTINPQVYRVAPDSVEADFYMAPGYSTVFLNGVRLLDYEFVRFNNNKVMFDVNVCGLQDLPLPGRMIDALPAHIRNKKVSENQTSDYSVFTELLQSPKVLRLIEDKIYYIPVSNRDSILIEKRDDTTIKTATFDILSSSYGTFDFNQDSYDIPESLITSGDLIKIYINGVYYDGDYVISNNGGIKGIKLLDKNAIVRDPLYEYFNMYPQERENYKMKYNKDYKHPIDKITFEWR